MAKSADAFRTISEVADWLDVQSHVLRFWESKFTQVKPVKRAGGRRYYRPADMLLLGGIHKLLREDGMTIKGVQKVLREKGMAYVADMSPPLDDTTEAALDTMLAPNPTPAPVAPPPAPEPTVIPLKPAPKASPPPAEEAPAAPEKTSEPSDMTPEAPEPVDDTPLAPPPPREEDTTIVPAFMRTQASGGAKAGEDAAPAPPAKPRIVDAPDERPDDTPILPSVLSRLRHVRALPPQQADDLRPLVAQLTALRDRMAAHRGQRTEE